MGISQRLKRIKELASNLAKEIEAFEQETEPQHPPRKKTNIPTEIDEQLRKLCESFNK